MCHGADDLVVAVQFALGEAVDLLPAETGQPAYRVVEKVPVIRLFHIDLDLAVLLHLRVDDLRAVVQGQKRIHHRKRLLGNCAKRKKRFSNRKNQMEELS